MPDRKRLILASGSAARKAMLEAAGLTFDVIPADIDEALVRDNLVRSDRHAGPAAVATVLAAQKAEHVSRANPHALVIGADQVLEMDRKLFAKAGNMGEARQILKELRGRTHVLVSGVALARGGAVIWRTSASAELTMRSFSDTFLEVYLETIGDQALRGVGCYELEGLGVQLFESVKGDWFTILGVPLLPLLARLRQEEVFAT